jgi:hypothetical protein
MTFEFLADFECENENRSEAKPAGEVFMNREVLVITLLVELLVFTLWRFRQELSRTATPRKSEQFRDWLRTQFSKRVPVLL